MSFLKGLLGNDDFERIDPHKRFKLLGRIGQGSMSKVWKARDRRNGKLIALKILDLEKTKMYESRFVGLDKPSEGEIAYQLIHPNIVRTFDYGWTLEGTQYLVMEYVEGKSLSYYVDSQNQLMKEIRLQLIVQLGEAITYFHSSDWIHRDICPRNVLLDDNHEIKLIDFGLVVPATPPFCKPGNRTGTAAYMAPELIRRQPTDQRIDVFSYAATCYEMYTGELPWTSSQTIDAVRQRLNETPKDIRLLEPDIDEQVAETIMHGLEFRPDDRWQSVAEMMLRFKRIDCRLRGIPLPDHLLDEDDDYEDAVPVPESGLPSYVEDDEYEEMLPIDFDNDDEYEEVSLVAEETELSEQADPTSTETISLAEEEDADNEHYVLRLEADDDDDEDDDEYEEVVPVAGQSSRSPGGRHITTSLPEDDPFDIFISEVTEEAKREEEIKNNPKLKKIDRQKGKAAKAKRSVHKRRRQKPD